MKLNIASGGTQVPDFINVDDFIYPLQFNQVEVIRASHIIEDFSTEESIKVLCQWTDCLASGGTLKIAVPDFGDLARRYMLGESHPYEGIFMGGQVNELDFHKSLWTYEKLYFIMENIGLKNISTWQSKIEDCASYPFSLNLKGTKE